MRSPLQACENLGRREGCSPTGNSPLVLGENQTPLSPISPAFEGRLGEPCLPLCVRRSTTYTSLPAPENGELWKLEGANISEDVHERALAETSFNSVNGDGQVEADSQLILPPNCSSTWNVTQSHGSFLSPDSFLKNSHAADHELNSVPCVSPDTFLKDNAGPVHLESKTGHEVHQTILSPDSFLKDNYGLSQEVESESVTPTLESPSRFVKDNRTHRCVSQPMCKLSPLLNGNSQASASLQVQRKNEVLLYIPECQGSESPETIFEDPKSSETKAKCDSFTKHNQPRLSAVPDISGFSHNTQLKRRPILSATVTKSKPPGARENNPQTIQPKARRCLRSVEGEGEKVANNVDEKDAFHSYLPVIDSAVSSSTGCKNVIEPSPKAASAARKRKSEGNREEARELVGATELTGAPAIQRVHFSPSESATSAAKKTRTGVTPVSKHVSGREKPHPRKRAGEWSVGLE